MLFITSVGVWGATDTPLAFPGASGFGSIAAGGRGGDVYRVTTLADDGPGSLREGITTASGPRTIVFAIGGTIDLQSTLVIDASKLTIAGQTAPGGIGVRGYPTRVQSAEDVVIRYMRFRPGDINAAHLPDKPGKGNEDLPGDAADALSIARSNRVIIDHCSASWGTDENLSVTGSNNVTVAHSIVSEGLQFSFHPEGPHSQGSLLRGQGEGGYTMFGNIYAHNGLRNPAFGGEEGDSKSGTPRKGLDLDFDNNVIYNWGLAPIHTVRGQGRVRVNFRSNVLIVGPSTDELCRQCAFVYVDPVADDELSIYQNGNVFDFDQDGVLSLNRVTELSFIDEEGRPLTLLADESFDFPRHSPKVLPARIALIRAIFRAGASLSRDQIDWRIIREVLKQSGGIIDSQDEVGGWPLDPPPRAAPLDLDQDGMSDVWEYRQGLDSGDADDRNRFDLSPLYTNLEVYLHSRTRTFHKTRRRRCM